MPASKVPVTTTFPTSPLPPAHSREPILTSRLLLRPLIPSDLRFVHQLRTQHNVMIWTSTGRIDSDEEATQTWLNRFLPPKDESTYNWAIIHRDGEHKGEWIGVGGCHHFPGPEGWPEVGYMLREEFWRKGLASEFLKAWIESWWSLPRSAVTIEVNEDTPITDVMSPNFPETQSDAPELLLAETELKNIGSNRILEKCGFEKFREWDEDGYRLAKWRLQRPS